MGRVQLLQAYEILKANPNVVFLVRLNDRKFPNVRRSDCLPQKSEFKVVRQFSRIDSASKEIDAFSNRIDSIFHQIDSVSNPIESVSA